MSIPIGLTKGRNGEGTFGLSFTADSGLLEGLLLLLNGRSLFDRLALSTTASEKHMGDAVSDGRTDGNGTRRSSHLG